MHGGLDLADVLNSLVGNIKAANTNKAESGSSALATFQDRMAAGLTSFTGPVLILLSQRDLTAQEFLEFTGSSSRWTGLLHRANVERHDFSDADHTFSTAESRDDVESRTVDWLRRMFPPQQR
jgi:hypothetical protein